MGHRVALFFPIVVIMFTAVLYQSIAVADVSDTVTFLNGSSSSWANTSNIGGTWSENGTVTTVETEAVSLTVGFDWATGALAVMVGGIAIIAILGIRVLGSGLSDFSVEAISKIALFYVFWLFFSLFALEAFELMPFYLGWVLYLFLTMFYSFGIMEELD